MIKGCASGPGAHTQECVGRAPARIAQQAHPTAPAPAVSRLAQAYPDPCGAARADKEEPGGFGATLMTRRACSWVTRRGTRHTEWRAMLQASGIVYVSSDQMFCINSCTKIQNQDIYFLAPRPCDWAFLEALPCHAIFKWDLQARS